MKPMTEQHKTMLEEICARAQTFNKPPAFQFYVDAWLSSSSIAAMSPAQEGAYIHLLALCWSNARLALTGDPGKLALMSRLNGDWAALGPEILTNFVEHPIDGPGWLTNTKLIEVRYNSMLHAAAGQAGGKRSGKQNASETASETQPSHLSSLSSPLSADGLQLASSKRAPSPDGLGLARFLHSELVRVRPNEPASKQVGAELERRLVKWALDFDAFGRIDKVSVADYRAIIAWALADDFWRTNIGSPGSLRTLRKGAPAKVWADFRKPRAKVGYDGVY